MDRNSNNRCFLCIMPLFELQHSFTCLQKPGAQPFLAAWAMEKKKTLKIDFVLLRVKMKRRDVFRCNFDLSFDSFGSEPSCWLMLFGSTYLVHVTLAMKLGECRGSLVEDTWWSATEALEVMFWERASVKCIVKRLRVTLVICITSLSPSSPVQSDELTHGVLEDAVVFCQSHPQSICHVSSFLRYATSCEKPAVDCEFAGPVKALGLMEELVMWVVPNMNGKHMNMLPFFRGKSSGMPFMSARNIEWKRSLESTNSTQRTEQSSWTSPRRLHNFCT